MRIRLTPELSYILGLWRHRKIPTGIGIRGNPQLLAVFSDAVLKEGLTEPGKLLSDKDTVYFYHSAYKRYLTELENEIPDRFRYKNEYSQAYLAGLFDARGGFTETGLPYIARADAKDEMVLLRLGFRCELIRDKLLIKDPRFLLYIKPWVRLTDVDYYLKRISFKSEEPKD